MQGGGGAWERRPAVAGGGESYRPMHPGGGGGGSYLPMQVGGGGGAGTSDAAWGPPPARVPSRTAKAEVKVEAEEAGWAGPSRDLQVRLHGKARDGDIYTIAGAVSALIAL